MTIKIFFLITTILNLIICSGQDSEVSAGQPLISGGRIDFEQDFLLSYLGLMGLNSDRNYTQGGGLTLLTRPGNLSNHVFSSELRSNPGFNIENPVEYSFLFAAFTPNELRISDPIVGDRPYSTLLMLSGKYSLLNIATSRLVQKGYYIGVLGVVGLAENLQTKIHVGMNEGNTKDPFNPMGWSNQISHGGELTGMYLFNSTRLLSNRKMRAEINRQAKDRSYLNYMVSYSLGYNIGYLTQATGGLNLKFGRLDYSKWATDHFNNLSVPAAVTPDEVLEYYQLESINELYVFASVSPAITIYNASLHGGFRETTYRLPYAETGFINSQARLGIAFTTSRTALAVYWAFKSPEMWNEYNRIHSWGGLSFTVIP